MIAAERITNTGRYSNMKIQGFLVALLLLVSAGVAYGQAGGTGTILGTVTDTSGATVANAKVHVTNVATGVTTDMTTGSAGDYTTPYLKPGLYKVTVEATGFEKSVVNNINLVVAQDARADVVMKPGAISETVEVTASAVALDTDTSAVSQSVTQRQVEDLPLNGRNFLDLLFIGAGAVETVGEQGQMRQSEGNAISINGGRPESTNYTLDGLVNTDPALNTPAVILSQDAIQEFKVQSDTYSAEYGFSANQVNIVSKSGTNEIHGTGFEFLRNDDFDARSTFQPTLPELRQNQFGFVIGGPVYLPKAYDGRNKTFWLVNYEGWRIRNGSNLFANVPDPTQLGGNFSGSGLPAYGTPACTTALAASLACMPVDPTTGAPFPGDTIPTSSFSRIATAELAAGLFPAPNCLTPASCPGNYRLNTVLPNSVNQQTYKLDQNLGRFGSVFFRFTNSNYSNEGLSGSLSVPAGVSVFNETSQSWEISHTVDLGHGLINNFRFGRLDPISNQGGIPAPVSAVTAMGITGVFQNLPAYARLWPTISFNGNFPTGGGAVFGSQGNDTTTSNIPTWEFADSVSKSFGKHTLGVGIDYREWVEKRDLSADFLGDFNYASTTIQQNGNGCPTVDCGTGNQVADFLLGYYATASTYQPGPFSKPGQAGNLNQYHFKYLAPWVQDDWKVNSRLTLNLGLRWDYRSVPFEQDNKMFWFDINQPGGGLCFADKTLLTDNIAPAGNGFYDYCGRNNPADGSKKPFAPRIGIAYRPFDNKTVVRAGYGLFFDSSESREIDDSGDIYPFVVRASPNPTQDPTLPKTTDNMFPPVTLHTVSAATDGSQFFAVIISEHPRNPYSEQASLSIERELAKNTTLEVFYTGNRGVHLLDRTNIGQPFAPTTSPALCQSSGGTAGDCPVADRRPYANITSSNGFLDSEWDGYSNYNAANVKFERRTSQMAFVAVYTWAKSLDDKSAAAGIGSTNAFAGHMDEHDARLDYGQSDFDVPQRFVASYIYNLPFGKGKRYGSTMNRAEDLLVGGWEVTGVTTFQKGFPFSATANDNLSLLTTFTQRADLVSGCNPYAGFTKSVNEWINTACFSQPLAGAFGTSGRNILRGPGINNWDLGLEKSFQFTERVRFQLRMEAFNSFNHTQYGVDPNSPGVGPGTSAVDTNVNDARFGDVVYARPGRIVQLGGKLIF